MALISMLHWLYIHHTKWALYPSYQMDPISIIPNGPYIHHAKMSFISIMLNGPYIHVKWALY